MLAPILIVAGQISEQPPSGLFSWLTEAGLLGGALAIAWLLFTERLVPGKVYRRDVDEERERTREALGLLRKSLGTNEQAVEKLR